VSEGGDDKKTVQQPISQVDPTQLGAAPPPTSSADALIGREDLIAGYRLVAKLGEGGMGVVYRGLQLSLNRDVAIKVMKVFGNDSDTGFQARFKREALAAAKLNHPHIVSIFDHGSAHGTIYMVLEFIPGKDCGEILQESGPYEEKAAFELIRDVVLGLSHANEHGVIHRDIKPANIMVAYQGMSDAQRREGGVAKLTDFGIAALHRKAKEPGMTELTQQGTVIGTPGYMSPEQSMGKEVDFRSDIYSLGCTLYYLVTGKPPYFGQTAIEVFHNKMTQQIPNPRDLRDGVSEGAVEVMARMMARDANDRYQDYAHLLKDIDDVIAGRRPESGEVPAVSQSIAPSMGVPMGDETAMAATALAGTAASVPPAAGSRSSFGAAKGKKSPMLPILGVGGLLALGALAFFLISGSGSGDGSNEGSSSGEGGRPATMAAFMESSEEAASTDLLANLESRRAQFQSLVGDMSDVKERAAAEKRWNSIVTKAVRDTDRERLEEMRKLQKEARWPELSDRLEEAHRVFEISGVRPSTTMRRLIEMRGDIRDRGEQERAAWTAIQTEEDPAKKRSALIDYVAAYGFSPELSEAKGMLGKIPAPEAQLAACEKLIEELANLSREDFLAESKSLEKEATAAFSKLSSAESRRLRGQLRETLKEKRERLATEIILGLDRQWQEGRYAALAESTAVAKTDIKERLRVRGAADRVAKFERIVKAAVTEGLGSKEREIVRKVDASENDVEVVNLLDGFATTYWFSPDLDRMNKRLEKAQASLPALSVKTPGGSGDLIIDGEARGRTPWSGRLPRGTHRIEIREAGFYPVSFTRDHREAADLILPLFAKPLERRTPVAQRYLALLLKQGHPLRNKPGVATWGPGIGGVLGEDPESAALTLTPDEASMRRKSWVTSSLSLREYLEFRSIRGGKGWRVRLNVRRNSGAAEVRLKSGSNQAVVRLSADGISVGRENELFLVPDSKLDAGQLQGLSIEWHGDVLVVRPGTSNAEDRILGSIRFDKFSTDCEMTIAVRNGESKFGNLAVQKME
jgi:serine/threonine protein kinase